MKDRVLYTRFLFLSLLLLSIFTCFAEANPNGYTVEPAVPGMDTGTPLETVPVEFWDLPPEIMVLSLAMTVSVSLGVPLEFFLLIKLYAYLGYRKVTRKFVLENNARNQLFRVIQDNPGIYFNSLERMTGIRHGTLRYHLFILRTTGKITTLQRSGDVRYFENCGMFSDKEKMVLRYIQNDTDNLILTLLLRNPGMARKDLTEKTGMSGPLVTWYIKRLRDDGIIHAQKQGRFVRYTVNPEVMQYLRKYIPSTGSFPG